MIAALVGNFGTKSWPVVAKALPGRSAKMCRERWEQHLDPKANRTPWSEDENR